MSCEHCTDPDGQPCYPSYGVAPHECFYKIPGAKIGESQVLPRDQWPENFREDEDSPGHGIYWCAHCGEGKPPTHPAPERSETPASTGREPVAHVVDIDRNCNESIIDAALEPGTALYLAPAAARELDVDAERRDFEAWFNNAQVRGVWEAWQASAARRTDPAPARTDDVMRTLKNACDLAMRNTLAARIPECGDFGAIAQDLSWAIDQLSSPARAEQAAGAAEKCRSAEKAQAVQEDEAKDAAPAESTISTIRESIADYYRALNSRQHGGLAMDRAFRAIERELGMTWEMWNGAERAAIAAQAKAQEKGE